MPAASKRRARERPPRRARVAPRSHRGSRLPPPAGQPPPPPGNRSRRRAKRPASAACPSGLCAADHRNAMRVLFDHHFLGARDNERVNLVAGNRPALLPAAQDAPRTRGRSAAPITVTPAETILSIALPNSSGSTSYTVRPSTMRAACRRAGAHHNGTARAKLALSATGTQLIGPSEQLTPTAMRAQSGASPPPPRGVRP